MERELSVLIEFCESMGGGEISASAINAAGGGREEKCDSFSVGSVRHDVIGGGRI